MMISKSRFCKKPFLLYLMIYWWECDICLGNIWHSPFISHFLIYPMILYTYRYISLILQPIALHMISSLANFAGKLLFRTYASLLRFSYDNNAAASFTIIISFWLDSSDFISLDTYYASWFRVTIHTSLDTMTRLASPHSRLPDIFTLHEDERRATRFISLFILYRLAEYFTPSKLIFSYICLYHNEFVTLTHFWWARAAFAFAFSQSLILPLIIFSHHLYELYRHAPSFSASRRARDKHSLSCSMSFEY